MNWINNYVGIPYQVNGRSHDGVDCYGLIYLVAAEIKNVFLPDWATEDKSIKAAVKVLRRNLEDEIKSGKATELLHPEDWCMVTVHRARQPHHIGLYINGGVLHSDRGMGCSYLHWPRFKTIYPYKMRFWRWHQL